MKTVLITGVRGGIGSALAAYFKNKGYRVFGLDCRSVPEGWIDAYRLFDGSIENISEVYSDTGNMYYVRTDLTNAQSVEVAYAVVSNALREIDACIYMNGKGNESAAGDSHLAGIVHAAGKYDFNSLIEIPEAGFAGIFGINVFAAYRVNKAFFSLLKEDSRIVVVTSELAPLDPLPFTGIYGITKAALHNYCHSLRMEVQLLGIKVIEIRPGAVSTGLLDDSVSRISKFIKETENYKGSSARFKKIVDSVESKAIPPEKLAGIIYGIFVKDNPKFVYNINRNKLLLLMNMLPDRFQAWIIKKLLTKRGEA